ncbi:MAG: rhamnulokinase family protein [Anaerolineae bacterium]|nr:rhamnulokinase [Thermoflexales bacterium]MDW8407037.1 rhamnulokinase family protein [Anaerolineae bacterium]
MRYLAFDIGAESGRAILGDLRDGKLTLSEVHRFANGGVQVKNRLYWDALGLWREIKNGLRAAAQSGEVSAIGVDTWGVDYALLDQHGELLGNPYCYRDARTDGVMERVCARLGRERIFEITGIQFMPINTLYQWAVEREHNPSKVDLARRCLMMPDLLHYWMTGEMANEYTIASTSQAFDARRRVWSEELLQGIGMPISLLSDVLMPGTPLGRLLSSVSDETGIGNATVVLAGSHDTASAVAAVPFPPNGGVRAYISSGTWSLVGVEVDQPVINPQALAANITNEGGVGNKIRLLKNVMGLWLIQRCRAEWKVEGRDYSYDQITQMANEAVGFPSIVDPNDDAFLHPADMRKAIVQKCRETHQPVPSTPGEFARLIYASLAQAYRTVIGQIEGLIGQRIEAIHVVGGGSRSHILNQLTANACGRPVIAGPVEGTAIGNLLTQAMGMGEIGSLDELRDVVRRSFDIVRFEPKT